jgi:hypothetical protein
VKKAQLFYRSPFCTIFWAKKWLFTTPKTVKQTKIENQPNSNLSRTNFSYCLLPTKPRLSSFLQKKSFPACSQAVKKSNQIPSILLQHFKLIQMAANIITTEDLENFKVELLVELKEILGKYEDKNSPVQEDKTWIKSHQVQRMLGISPGTLQTLRINGTIPFSKVGGVLFYNKSDINKLLENNRKNHL